MRIKNILFLLIILIAVILRFYNLGIVPVGFLNDEANAGYDAYSLLLTAKDQWGNLLPINNFIGFGDFNPQLTDTYQYFLSFYLV